MGRKNWKESVSLKGPGRKARKQRDPELPAQLRERDSGVKKVRAGALGGRIKQRAKKRVAREELKLKAKTLSSKKLRAKDKDANLYRTVPPPPPLDDSSADAKMELAETDAKMELFVDGSGKVPYLL